MKVLGFLFLFILFFYQAGAQVSNKLVRGSRPKIDLEKVPETAFEKGKITIKFRPAALSFLKAATYSTTDSIVNFGIPQLDQLNDKYKINKITRVFETALSSCEYCPEHIQWGLDLWYNCILDNRADIKAAVMEFSALNALVELAEPVYRIQRYKAVPTEINFYQKQAIAQWYYSPNDPRFSEQWNLSNTGQQGGAIGKDISVSKAWDLAKGNPDVIVGIVDGGVDVKHPDLMNAMWNGIGYNFVNNSYQLDADEHGTHTAGSVAASTNNGTGISGIAGGEGLSGGVKIMSL
jgi:hypothetical protein